MPVRSHGPFDSSVPEPSLCSRGYPTDLASGEPEFDSQTLHEALCASELGVWSWTANTRRLQTDRATREITGWEGGSASLHGYLRRLHPEDRLGLLAALRSLSVSSPRFDQRHRLLDSEGRSLWVRLQGSGSFDGQQLRKLSGSIRDISTELRAAYLDANAERLTRVGRFAGGFAHDVNNLLTTVLGFADLLDLQLAGNATAQGDLSEIRAAAERGARLTRQLQTFARRSSHAWGSLPAHALLEAKRADLRIRLGRGAKLEWDVESRLPQVRADADSFGLLLSLLLDNAQEASPEDSTITLRAQTVAPESSTSGRRYLLLSLIDQGQGIPKEHLHDVMKPFFTTKGSLSAGLGLAIAHEIVVEMGGRIEVRSQIGIGTEVSLWIPEASDR